MLEYSGLATVGLLGPDDNILPLLLTVTFAGVWADYKSRYHFMSLNEGFIPWFLFPLCILRECSDCALTVFLSCSAAVFIGIT